MRTLFFIIICLLTLNTYAQNDENQFSGTYEGTYEDFYSKKGKITVSLYPGVQGTSSGIILISPLEEKKPTTGVISIQSHNGEYIQGSFISSSASVINTKKDSMTTSFDCSWQFYAKIKDGVITGEAVPVNCTESNLMKFILKNKI